MTNGQPSSPLHGLPPVQPPSGQMILRLFLVPFLIVAILVGIYLLGQLFFGNAGRFRSPEQFLRNLDSTNPDIRWRAASDLSQELPRSPELAGNASFALELAERMHAALKDSQLAEKDFASRVSTLSETDRERLLLKDLDANRKLIMYLGACLGNFVVPVGTPLLNELARQSSGMEPEALAERRSRALFALAVLGENLKRYDSLSEVEQSRIDEELSSALSNEVQAKWAKPTLTYLQQRRQGKADSFGVIPTLQTCSEDEDPYLRELTALAANFWKGTPQEESILEDLLGRLAVDAGVGEEILQERQARNPESRTTQALSTRKGFQVQVNANLTLARRGSARVRLDLLEEMMDPESLRKIFVLRPLHPGREVVADQPNESLVLITLTSTLKALRELHERRPELALDRLKAKVQHLEQDANATVRQEAQLTLQSLQR